jgi:hypothetical protein
VGNGEDPFEECGPAEAAGEDRGRDLGRRDDADVVGDERRHSGNDVAAAGGVESEDAVILEGVSSRRRGEGGEAAQQLEGGQEQGADAVVAGPLEAAGDLAHPRRGRGGTARVFDLVRTRHLKLNVWAVTGGSLSSDEAAVEYLTDQLAGRRGAIGSLTTQRLAKCHAPCTE